ncbi:MAG TPA: hypothetical protein VEY05_05480, partial [Beijerinckiaceae bacterium]|nr:hypothetical protein [Beijerinckiaceae bacterium]
MERNPVRFVWSSSPALHAGSLALLLLAAPLLWLAIDLVRVAVDDAIVGRAFAGRGEAPFLRMAISLPERIREEPVVLFAGFPLERQSFVMATTAGLVLTAVVLSIGALAFAALRAVAGASAVERLRRQLLDGIVGARPSARDEVAQAAVLAGDAIARDNDFLGAAVLTPAAAGVAIAVALVYALSLDWRLAAALGLALGAMALVWPRRIEALRRLGDSRLAEGAALRRLLT